MNIQSNSSFRIILLSFSLLSLLRVSAISAPGDISTVAGTGISNESGMDGGPATATALNNPEGVAVDRDGNVYLSEYFGHKIRKIDAVSGVISTIVGTGTGGFNGDGLPGNQTQVFRPGTLQIGPDGSLYFADFANSRIRRYDPETTLVSTFAGTGEISPFTPDGAHRTQTVLQGAGYFDFAPNGDLIYGENSFAYIRKSDAITGIVTTILGDGTRASTGDGGPASEARTKATTSILVAPDGAIYFGEQRLVRKIDSQTNLVTAFAGGGNDRSGDEIGARLAHIDFARGLALDAAGNLFFGEDASRISRVDPRTNLIKTIAGTRNPGYNGENVPAISSDIGYPGQMTFDQEGNLYFAEGYYGRVRKIEAAGGSAPTGSGPGTTRSAPKTDLLIGQNSGKMKGNNHYDKRNASRMQTLNFSASIFRQHNANLILQIENDSTSPSTSEFRLQARRTSNPGITSKVFAQKQGGGRRVITGAMKRRGYTFKLAGGESARVIYQMTTGRFWAGAQNRKGQRQNLIRFKANSRGTSDHCAAVTHFR